MSAKDIWPWLAEERTLLCRNLSEAPDSGERYRVPVVHRTLGERFAADPAALRALPAGHSMDQLREILEETGGLGLFAPRLWEMGPLDSRQSQAAHGSILVWPTSEWARIRSEFADWCYDGGVESAFDGRKYGFEDIVIFASINFTPDCWFLVVRGPLEGKVLWWTHDGDSELESPWAEDIADWGLRVRRETPEVFGGCVRFDPTASEDEAPLGAELYPEALASG